MSYVLVPALELLWAGDPPLLRSHLGRHLKNASIVRRVALAPPYIVGAAACAKHSDSCLLVVSRVGHPVAPEGMHAPLILSRSTLSRARPVL